MFTTFKTTSSIRVYFFQDSSDTHFHGEGNTRQGIPEVTGEIGPNNENLKKLGWDVLQKQCKSILTNTSIGFDYNRVVKILPIILEFAKLYKDKNLQDIVDYYVKEFNKKNSNDTMNDFKIRALLYLDLATLVDVFDKPIERDTHLIVLHEKYVLRSEDWDSESPPISPYQETPPTE